MTISPSGIIPFCDGERLEVTRTITVGSLLRWNITSNQAHPETVLAQSFARTFSSAGPSSHQSPINTSSTVITFVRSSAEGHTPLISTISITKIPNGTTIKCVEILTSESAIVVVHVMDSVNHCKI